MKRNNKYLIISTVLVLIALGSLAYLGVFTRWHADDFCIAASARQMDAVTFFNHWYSGWTGRFVYIPVAGLLALGGPQLAGWLPVLTTMLWVCVIGWTLEVLFKYFQWRHPKLMAIFFSAFFLAVLYSSTPNLFQSLFWKDGLINYGFPLIGMTISIGLLLRLWLRANTKKIGWLSLILTFSLALFSGGFSEIFATVQITFYLILLLNILIFSDPEQKNHFRSVVLAGLMGAVCAYVILLSAPGNLVRGDLIAVRPGLVRLVTFTFRNAFVIIGKFLLQNPLWAAAAVLIPFVIGFTYILEHDKQNIKDEKRQFWQEDWFKGILQLLLAAFLLTLAACAPVVYMLNAYPDERSIIIPLYFIILALMCSSGLLGYGLRRSWAQENKADSYLNGNFVVLALALIISAISVIKVWQQVPDFRDYAARWDRRHQELMILSSYTSEPVEAFGLENRFGISDLRVEEDYWVNRCMADYYGFSAIIGK